MIKVETPPDSLKDVIADFSIRLPLQKNVKLLTEVASIPEGATCHPEAKVTVVVF